MTHDKWGERWKKKGKWDLKDEYDLHTLYHKGCVGWYRLGTVNVPVPSMSDLSNNQLLLLHSKCKNLRKEDWWALNACLFPNFSDVICLIENIIFLHMTESQLGILRKIPGQHQLSINAPNSGYWYWENGELLCLTRRLLWSFCILYETNYSDVQIRTFFVSDSFPNTCGYLSGHSIVPCFSIDLWRVHYQYIFE